MMRLLLITAAAYTSLAVYVYLWLSNREEWQW